jgi:hypothetical protein
MNIEEGGVGLVAGLFEPSWLAKTSFGNGLGALAAKFGQHRFDSRIAKKRNETLAAGDAVSVAIYDYDDADAVTNSLKTSSADIDGNSVKDLKAGMAEAEAGMASRPARPRSRRPVERGANRLIPNAAQAPPEVRERVDLVLVPVDAGIQRDSFLFVGSLGARVRARTRQACLRDDENLELKTLNLKVGLAVFDIGSHVRQRSEVLAFEHRAALLAHELDQPRRLGLAPVQIRKECSVSKLITSISPCCAAS